MPFGFVASGLVGLHWFAPVSGKTNHAVASGKVLPGSGGGGGDGQPETPAKLLSKI